MTARRATENAEAAALCDWFARQYPQIAGLLLHFENEIGLAGANKGALLGALKRRKARGVQTGVADYFLAVPCPPKSQCGLFLELKAPGGTLKRDQIAFLERVAPNYGAVCAWGWEGASLAICEYLGARLPLGRVFGIFGATTAPLSAFTMTGTMRKEKRA